MEMLQRNGRVNIREMRNTIATNAVLTNSLLSFSFLIFCLFLFEGYVLQIIDFWSLRQLLKTCLYFKYIFFVRIQ